ncbi:hypothetical protein ACQKWADRAFT_224525 [Trichoderma austrokoningii]
MSLPTSGLGAQSQSQLGSESQPQPRSQPQQSLRSDRGNPLPLFSFQQPPTSLVPSTAEGKPIPVDDSTVEYRTSALRELNLNFPSHRYAKSAGAQSSTYSEPVIVRSYYPPLPSSRPTSSSRGPAVIHGGPVSGGPGVVVGAGSGSQVGRFAEAVAGGLPLPSRLVSGEHGMLSTMVLSFGKKPVNGRVEDEARLPPIDAFSFKSFMDSIEAQGGGLAGDINADLDRIAEICARSRYSLSNQYEVHYTPHGSGASFLHPSAQSNDSQGPTLQAVSAEDEQSVAAASSSSTRRKRHMARRSSRAVGTLETIISSSRSSDEEQQQASRKKSAAEIAEQVRGRSAQKSSGHSSASSSSSGTLDDAPKKSSSSLALIDASTRQGVAVDSPRTSATGLVSEPAQPQESTSQLEIRTATSDVVEGRPVVVKDTPHHAKQRSLSVAKGAITAIGTDTASGGILSIINGWMPWRPSSPFIHHRGLAEGSLRELLRSTEPKGKGPEILQ